MLHHLSFAVSNRNKSAQFYDACLTCLGYRRVAESDGFIGYGKLDGQDKFAIVAQENMNTPPTSGLHLAFEAMNRAEVDRFYEQAIDNGAPGIRENYSLLYYAAFVIDPDGYHIEIVINK